MTRMLASVNGPAEAEIALAGGADIIDLKDPTRGALGAVASGVIGATVRAVGKRRLVSAVAGDLPPVQAPSARFHDHLCLQLVQCHTHVLKHTQRRPGILPAGAGYPLLPRLVTADSREEPLHQRGIPLKAVRRALARGGSLIGCLLRERG